MITVYTAVVVIRNLAAVSLSEYQPCQIIICALRTSAKDDCFYHCIYLDMTRPTKTLMRLTVPWPKLDNAIKTLRYDF